MMNIVQSISEFGSQISQTIFHIFDKKQLDKLARETNFVQRSTSKIEGSDLLELMTTEIVQEPNIPYEGLCDRLREINPKAIMTPQGLEQRINSEGSVKFLEESLKLALQNNLKLQKEKTEIKSLSPFRRIFLEDSTQGILHEKLADEFKGSGGSASKAGLKVNLVYEYKQSNIYELKVSKSAIADQSRACTFLGQLQADDLILRDLGYFKIKGLSQIEDKNAFYLSRLLSNVDVYLHDTDQEPINLPRHLNKVYSQENVIELSIYIGKNDRLKTRLIAYKLPQEVVRMRRYKARQNASKKGRTPTQTYLEWLEFSFFITNVPVEIWPTKVVGTIYRLRWQIELIFKNWKGLLNIDILKGTRPERVKCLVYGRLISVIIMTMFCSFASMVAQLQFHREISFHKVIQWLLRSERLANAVRHNLIDSLIEILSLNVKRLCKQKRKRKTTKELVNNQIDYLDSFDDYISCDDSTTSV